MPWRTAPHLTKSNYLAGLQCSLRLWKQVHTPKPFVEPFPGTPQYEGHRIGELARQCFPGGELIENPTSDHEGASEHTKRLMMSGWPAIFEGAFEDGNRRVRPCCSLGTLHGLSPPPSSPRLPPPRSLSSSSPLSLLSVI